MGLSSEQIFEYLEKRISGFEKTKKNGAHLFTCPNLSNHKLKTVGPTATIISGSDKLACLRCGWKGSMYDAIRLLEPDKLNRSDAEITEYLMNSMKLDMYSELEMYKQLSFALVPIAKNSKNPIEKDWTTICHYEKVDWIKWLNNELNIGVRTGEVSGITVIDVDFKGEVDVNLIQLQKDIIDSLQNANTLTQNSPHGIHYVFKYDKDIPQTVNIANLHIDTRNDGGQILVQPSKIDALCYTWRNLGTEIKEIPTQMKDDLLKLIKAAKKRTEEVTIKAEEVKIQGEGGRNNTLTSIGGLLINKLTPAQTEYVLNIISHNFMSPPLPGFEIKNLMGSLAGYKENEDSTQENMIFDYLKQMQNDVNAKDIMDSLKLSRAVVDKYLSKFVKDGKAIRLSRGRYKYREKVEWSDKFPTHNVEVAYKIPYFDEIAHFSSGDIILLGGKPKHGKSTIGLNIIRQMVIQGIKPYYIYSESGSRHIKTAQKLGLDEGSFYSAFHANPLSIEIEPESFTVLDWLMISEKENSDAVFKFFTEEVQRKGGILVIMMQLKENYDFFAPNMVTQFPALAGRYIFDSEDGIAGHWQLDAIRDPIGNYRNYVVPCEYNHDTKILQKKDQI